MDDLISSDEQAIRQAAWWADWECNGPASVPWEVINASDVTHTEDPNGTLVYEVTLPDNRCIFVRSLDGECEEV